MVLEAGYANTTGFRKVVKASIMVKKKPDISDEDFIHHYTQKHAQMAAPVLEKHGIITYSLVRGISTSSNFLLIPSTEPWLRSHHVSYCSHSASNEIAQSLQICCTAR